MNRFLIVTLILVIRLLSVQSGLGRSPLDLIGENPTASSVELDIDLEKKRAATAEQLRVAQRALDAAKKAASQSDAKPPPALSGEVELLKQIDVIVAQQQAARAVIVELRGRRADLASQLANTRANGPRETKPYSFLLLDQLRDELESQQNRNGTIAATVASANQAATRAKAKLTEKQQAYRQAKDATSNSPAKSSELAKKTKLSELQNQLAEERLVLRRVELDKEQTAKQVHDVRVSLLKERIRWIARDTCFSEGDLQTQFMEIEKQDADLRRSLESAESNLAYAERQWFAARQRLDAGMDEQPALEEKVEAKRLARQMRQQQIAVYHARLRRLSEMRQTWNRRFRLIVGRATPEELIQWKNETASYVQQIEREHQIQTLRVDEVRQDIAGLEKKLHANGQADESDAWIREQQTALQGLIRIYDSNIVSMESSRRLNEKLLRGIEGDIRHWSARQWAAGARHYVAKVWNTEVINADGRPITIGKIVMGVALLLFGFALSKKLSRALGQRLLRRVGVNESESAALQSIAFYCLVVVCSLMALRLANVPLTVFTFLGGAIAIGVGFGSQSILNNFISGLILLAERPIRVGDLIQMDDLYGTVEHMGTRSTRIRTAANMEIIVPNSSFLQNNVLNLTLGDNKIRTNIKIGIAYGSPTRDAARLMKRAAREHGLVLDTPEPFVWFTDFGDNSLNFELHLWVEVRNVTERRRIESDLRFKINELLREAGIVIAFPQRDVHMSMEGPVNVRLLPADQDRLPVVDETRLDAA